MPNVNSTLCGSSGFGLNDAEVDRVLTRAFAEDLPSIDVTAVATVPADARASALIVAKQPLVVCGVAVAARACTRMDPEACFEQLADEGAEVDAGTRVARVQANARALLGAERTALNLLQRMCGVATIVRQYAEAAGASCRVVDTRKTTPGLRALQRYAVRCGGGHNHRNDLGSGVLIKENHIRAAGGIAKAIVSARSFAPHTLRIECEVQSVTEAEQAVEAGAEIVMLDNMSNTQVEQAVAALRGRACIEVSGGITLERVPALARLGVDVISVGAFTHSAPAADLSLLFETPQ